VLSSCGASSPYPSIRAPIPVTASLDTATKAELRILCKAAGIAYGKLDNAGMRAALKAHAGDAPERLTDAVP
jgi:hypothetical protein